MTSNNYKIAILQEIWLRENENFIFKAHRMISKRRAEGYGGVGILVHEDLDFDELALPNLRKLEAVGLKITRGFDQLNIISAYFPPSSGSNGDFRQDMVTFFKFLEDLEGETVVGADLNAHHTAWSPAFPTCARGKVVSELVEESKLVLLNDGSPTVITSPGGRESAIDLTLVTPGLARKATWEVEQEDFGSVHMSIRLELSSEIPVVKGTVKRINKAKVVEQLNNMRPQFIYSPEEMVEVFHEVVSNASFSVKNKKSNFLKTWWTKEIGSLYESKRAALRTYNIDKTRTNYLALQRERAAFKKEVRKTKRVYVREMMEKVDEATPARQLWNLVKGIDTALSGKHRKRLEIPLEEGKQFMNYYFEDKLKPVLFPRGSTESLLEGYEMGIKGGEFAKVLKGKKNHSAPGVTGISYDILKQLNLGMQDKIWEMLSRIFVSENIPEEWRVAEVRPIPKKDRNYHQPSDRRPIALLNVEIKLINGAVKNRLSEIAEIKGLIPELSFGFQKHRSASTCVAYVVNKIHEAKEQNQEVIVTFIDVSMAYDSVDTSILLETLVKMGVPQKIVSWLYEYLRSRKMVMDTEEGKVAVEVSEGLPQGCPLSPILFNLYTASLHDLSNEKGVLVQFADDFSIIVTADTLEEAAEISSKLLGSLYERLRALNLRVCPRKSAAIPFSRKNTSHIKVRVQNEKIEMVNTHQYLGYTLDRELRHRKHLENIRDKAGKKLGLMKMLSKKSGGANPETLIKIGNAIVRSRMEYGAAIFGNAAKTNLEKLQTTQNSYIRQAMGYLPSTPVQVMLAEAGQTPMQHRIESLTKREIIRSTYFRTPLSKFINVTLNREMGNGSFLTETAEKHMDLLFQVHPSDKELAERKRMRYVQRLELDRVVVPTLGEPNCKKGNISRNVWQGLFREAVQTVYQGFNRIFTDGSKTPAGTAFAVWDDTNGSSVAENINSNFTITNAELLGILKAIELTKLNGYKKAVIFTDSRSACEILLNESNLETNYIVWEIYKELQEACNITIKVQWIPSHVGIEGNEKVDTIAVEKSHEKQSFFNGITLGDAVLLSNQEIWNDWTRSYKEKSLNKGKWHASIMDTPGRKSWFKGLQLNPYEIRTINRLRSGHTLTKDRRAAWGWESDNLCEWCEVVEDIKHIIYDCPRYNIVRSKYGVLEYMKPLELILEENCEEELRQVTNFLKETKTQI